MLEIEPLQHLTGLMDVARLVIVGDGSAAHDQCAQTNSVSEKRHTDFI